MDELKSSNPQTDTISSVGNPAITEKPAPVSTSFVHTAFSDFLLRLEQLRASHPDWKDQRNQNRPFKASFIRFLRNLVLRLPVAPEMTPLVNGSVRLRYKKRAPRDKWQLLEFVIYPQRYFEMTAKSRIASNPPFQRTNTARPDYISDMIQAFFEYDYVNTKEHPVRFRKATVVDYPFIAAMCQSAFGPHTEYHPSKISKLCQYCYVADDPLYGIVSTAGISEDPVNGNYKVNFLITVQNYRGLSLASKCLRKAVSDLIAVDPDCTITAASPIPHDAVKDVAHSALKRAGFKKVKCVVGEKKYQNFDCDRCNTCNGYCTFDDASSVCSTLHYTLNAKNFHGKK